MYIRPRSNRMSKNRKFKTASCLAMYFVCPSAGQVDKMCTMCSGAVPHNLHVWSLLGLMCVLFMAYLRCVRQCTTNDPLLTIYQFFVHPPFLLIIASILLENYLSKTIYDICAHFSVSSTRCLKVANDSLVKCLDMASFSSFRFKT